MNELQLNLEAAQAAHAAAMQKVARLEDRRAAAEVARADAVAGRDRLVSDAAQGFEVHPKALTGADAAITSAKGTLDLWAEAKGRAIADAAIAEGPVKAAQRAIADVQFAKAARARIKASAKLAQAGREFGAAYEAWLATASEIHAAWNLGRVPASHELDNLRDTRQGAYAVPKNIQNIIVSTGSVVDLDLGQRERAVWAQYAAPDDATEGAPAAT